MMEGDTSALLQKAVLIMIVSPTPYEMLACAKVENRCSSWRTERSFGVRVACYRFCPSQLAGWDSCLARKKTNIDRNDERNPASKLAGLEFLHFQNELSRISALAPLGERVDRS